MTARRTLAIAALAVLALPGCMTRFVRESVLDESEVRIYLRSEKRLLGGGIDPGYEHPATIAPVRLTHILSRIDVRASVKEGNRREAAIATDFLFPAGEGLSQALARAESHQAVVVMLFRKDRSLGVFDRKYMTSFLTYVRDGSLFIHLSHRDWEVPDRRDLELPEPRVGDEYTKARMQPGIGMTVVNAQGVAIDWRNPVFARATRTKLLPTGEVLRKTILLESAPEAPDDVPAAFEIPDGITPEQLRDLADLEEQRRDGSITEPQYRSRKRDILERP
jgi:hypothetical protein